MTAEDSDYVYRALVQGMAFQPLQKPEGTAHIC